MDRPQVMREAVSYMPHHDFGFHTILLSLSKIAGATRLDSKNDYKIYIYIFVNGNLWFSLKPLSERHTKKHFNLQIEVFFCSTYDVEQLINGPCFAVKLPSTGLRQK